MARRIPKWEAELWTYVSSGDGERCPLRDDCRVIKACVWCPDENKERLNQFLEQDEVTLQSCDFIEADTGARIGRLFLLVELMVQRCLEMVKVDCPPVPTMLIGLIDPKGIIEVRQGDSCLRG